MAEHSLSGPRDLHLRGAEPRRPLHSDPRGEYPSRHLPRAPCCVPQLRDDAHTSPPSFRLQRPRPRRVPLARYRYRHHSLPAPLHLRRRRVEAPRFAPSPRCYLRALGRSRGVGDRWACSAGHATSSRLISVQPRHGSISLRGGRVAYWLIGFISSEHRPSFSELRSGNGRQTSTAARFQHEETCTRSPRATDRRGVTPPTKADHHPTRPRPPRPSRA